MRQAGGGAPHPLTRQTLDTPRVYFRPRRQQPGDTMKTISIFDHDNPQHDDEPRDDGAAHAVPGCKIIYAPAGQAGEYAPLATNPYKGCGHGCAYCYVPLILRMDRREFDAGANLRPGYL